MNDLTAIAVLITILVVAVSLALGMATYNMLLTRSLHKSWFYEPRKDPIDVWSDLVDDCPHCVGPISNYWDTPGGEPTGKERT